MLVIHTPCHILTTKAYEWNTVIAFDHSSLIPLVGWSRAEGFPLSKACLEQQEAWRYALPPAAGVNELHLPVEGLPAVLHHSKYSFYEENGTSRLDTVTLICRHCTHINRSFCLLVF